MRVLFLVIFLCCTGSMMAQDNALIIAHRGASYEAPENTLSSAKLAWQQGADAVELDIHLSADNRVMVIHDENTRRTTGVSYNVASVSADTLRLLDAGSWKNEKYKGEKIPFLDEILETVPPGKKLIIEIKSDKKIVPFLKSIIDNSGKKDQCIIISFNFEALADARVAMPDVPGYFLMDKVEVAGMDSLISNLKVSNISGLDLNFKTLTPEIVRYFCQKYIPLFAWTVDDPEMAKNLIRMGIVGITTNRPLEMRKALGY